MNDLIYNYIESRSVNNVCVNGELKNELIYNNSIHFNATNRMPFGQAIVKCGIKKKPFAQFILAPKINFQYNTKNYRSFFTVFMRFFFAEKAFFPS